MRVHPRLARPVSWALIVLLHLLLAWSFLNDGSPGTDAARTGFPLDDSWIHMVYGRAIAHHGLPYYNDGELEAGFTSPAWMLCIAGAELGHRLFGVSPVIVVKVLGVAAAAAASLLLFELNLALTGNALVSAAVAALAAGTPLVAFSQVSGMETSLTAALLLAALLALDRRRLLAAGIFCGLAYLARPESVVLAPLLLLGHALAERRDTPWWRAFLPGALKLTVPLLVAAGGWAIYCLAVNGHPLPNTYYAKVAPVSLFGENLRRILGEILLELPVASSVVGVVVYVVGAAGIARLARGAGVAAIGLPWLFLAGVAASRAMPAGCGTYFYWWRYVLPVLPALYAPLAVGGDFIWRHGGGGCSWSPGKPGGARRCLVAAGLFLALLAPLPRSAKQLDFRRWQFSWNCQNINEVQVAFGRWVNVTVRPDVAVLANDAGAIRYFGNRRTIDLLGLNNHELRFQPALGHRISAYPAATADYMSSLGASHLIVFPSWFPELVYNPEFPSHFAAEASFRSPNYTVLGARQDEMVAFRRIR